MLKSSSDLFKLLSKTLKSTFLTSLRSSDDHLNTTLQVSLKLKEKKIEKKKNQRPRKKNEIN